MTGAARSMNSAPARRAWQWSTTPPHKVTVYERLDRDGALWARWRAADDTGRTNWRKTSLGYRLAVDDEGNPRTRAEQEMVKRSAMADAARIQARLAAGLPGATPSDAPPPVTAALTLAETAAVITHAETGKYPADTPHRQEVLRELARAAQILGGATPWADVDVTLLTKLWRRRIRELHEAGRTGIRGAEITIVRFLAVAQWLRDRKRIPLTAAIAPSDWKDQMIADWQLLRRERGDSDQLPSPSRPRHTLDEMRRLLVAAPGVDPRFGLMMALGAEQRLGQVRRGMRSNVKLDAGDHGEFQVPTRGRKRGALVIFTAAQRESLDLALGPDGYLAELERAYLAGELQDYPLFPSGRLPGSGKGGALGRATLDRHATAKPIGDTALRKWWLHAETIAGVPNISGRGHYGVRRAAVDAAKSENISREGLQAHGGWSDSQIPDSIYADQQLRSAHEEAARVRARIRGEAEPSQPPKRKARRKPAEDGQNAE